MPSRSNRRVSDRPTPQALLGSVAELGGLRAFMRCHFLGVLERGTGGLLGKPIRLTGFGVWMGNFSDTLIDREANKLASEFIAKKIRQRVKDPAGRIGARRTVNGCAVSRIITTTPNELCAELHNRMPAQHLLRYGLAKTNPAHEPSLQLRPR